MDGRTDRRTDELRLPLRNGQALVYTFLADYELLFDDGPSRSAQSPSHAVGNSSSRRLHIFGVLVLNVKFVCDTGPLEGHLSYSLNKL